MTAKAEMPKGDGRLPRLYGRRHSRRLRPGRRELLQTRLPELRIALPRGDTPLDPRRLFPSDVTDIWLEIGFGGGEHLSELAAADPALGLIGCEPYLSGVASLLASLEARGAANVRIFDDDARLLLSALAEASIGRVFLLFPDPWPKARHHRRRFIAADTLVQLARVLRDGGELWFASDHADYVRWTLEHIGRNSSFRCSPCYSKDQYSRPTREFATRYERKALARGAHCTFLRIIRRPRGETAAKELMPRP